MDSKDSKSPQVVILVGGLGTRLRAVLGDDTPKPLALIEGKPFLWYLLRYVQREQLSRVVLATAHLSDAFQRDLASYVPPDMDVRFSFESAPRGTGGALVEALESVEIEPFVAMNGDSFIKAPLRDMLAAHTASGAVATIGLVEVPDSARFGTVRIDEDGEITAFLEKTGEAAPGWINAGIYILSREALAPVANMRVSSIERDVFPTWVGRGLRGFKIESPFIDIGLPETYEAAGRFFKECGYI